MNARQVDMETVKAFAAKRTEILPRNGAGINEATIEFQRRYVSLAVLKCRGNVSAAARYLNTNRQNMYRKLNQLQLMMDSPRIADMDPEQFYDVDVGGGI